MKEFDQYGMAGEIDAAEHSAPSYSKKVIPGPTTFAPDDDATPTRTKDPIVGAVGGASAELTLLQNKAYRVIADVAIYFRLSVTGSTAVATDIYLPANTPIIIKTELWQRLAYIQVATGGNIQAVEVR